MIRATTTRRLVTIPTLVALFAVSWVASPVLLMTASAVDLARWARTGTPWMATRLVLFLLVYLTAETFGLVALGATWPVSAERRIPHPARSAFAIQRWWAGLVTRACLSLFGLDLRATGVEQLARAPFILLARHASIVDNLLAAWFVSRPHRIHVRYVMKDELLWDPALDVAGHRLPNVFVRRGESETDVAAVRRLAESLTAREAVLIYPEGTRSTAHKQERALAVLARRSPAMHQRPSGLTHLLPPRPAGTLALIEACSADVVVMAHRGLDGFAHVRDVWRGAMVGRRIDVAFWRIERDRIPNGRAERVDWLFAEWVKLDRWIGEAHDG